MKKHFSVILFMLKKKLYKVLLVLLVMGLVSLLGFHFLGFTKASAFGMGNGSLFLEMISLLGYIGCILSCADLFSSKSHIAYTYQRLRISQREVILWDILTSMMMFFLFYAAQILILCLAAKDYTSLTGYQQGPQGIIAAFYRDSFLHGMLPLAEGRLWIRNIFYLMVSGCECARLSLCAQKQNKGNIGSAVLFAAMLVQFPAELGKSALELPFLILLVEIFLVGMMFMQAHNGKRRKEADEDAH